MKNILLIFTVFIIILIFAAHNNNNAFSKSVKYDSFEEVPESAWRELSNKKIFFGHKSVGENILAGIQDIVSNHPQINLKIIETSDLESIQPGTLAHFPIGKNGDPIGKIDHFYKLVENKNIDVALMKLCWADFTADTDYSGIFNHYSNTLGKIKKAQPQTVFLHTTVPLTLIQKGIKAKIKNLFGKTPWGIRENITRNNLNDLIREKYDAESIYDLARLESTYPDGSREQYSFEDKVYYALVKEYTYDSGHLNEIGREKAAKEFLLVLANF